MTAADRSRLRELAERSLPGFPSIMDACDLAEGTLTLLDRLAAVEAERDAARDDATRLKAEAVSVDNTLAEAAAALAEARTERDVALSDVRAYVEQLAHVEDVNVAHIIERDRAISGRDEAQADLAALDARIAELRGLLVEARPMLQHVIEARLAVGAIDLRDRIDAALKGGAK